MTSQPCNQRGAGHSEHARAVPLRPRGLVVAQGMALSSHVIGITGKRALRQIALQRVNDDVRCTACLDCAMNHRRLHGRSATPAAVVSPTLSPLNR